MDFFLGGEGDIETDTQTAIVFNQQFLFLVQKSESCEGFDS